MLKAGHFLDTLLNELQVQSARQVHFQKPRHNRPPYCNLFPLKKMWEGAAFGQRERGSRVFGSIKIKKAVIDFEALCRLRETQNRADCGESLWLRPERKCSVTLTG